MQSYIDLSTPENKAKWCKTFNCRFEEILDVVCKIGYNAEMVKVSLELKPKEEKSFVALS